MCEAMVDSPRAVIEELGGQAVVAKRLKIVVSAVSNWNRCGIPHGRISDLLQLAKEAGASAITVERLRALTPHRAKDIRESARTQRQPPEAA